MSVADIVSQRDHNRERVCMCVLRACACVCCNDKAKLTNFSFENAHKEETNNGNIAATGQQQRRVNQS